MRGPISATGVPRKCWPGPTCASGASPWWPAFRRSRWFSSTWPAGSCREPEVLTLDTGRLHEETHDFIEQVRQRYPIRLRILSPDSVELDAMTAEHGTMQFRRSVALRNECCAVRKVNPLARALQDYDAWITGLRREQTPTRAETPVVAGDPGPWRHHQGGATGRLVTRPGVGVPRCPGHRSSPALRPGLHVDRLRPVHSCNRGRRERAGRALVVGRGLRQGVPAPSAPRERFAGGSARKSGQCPIGRSALNFAAMSTEIASRVSLTRRVSSAGVITPLATPSASPVRTSARASASTLAAWVPAI